MTPNGSETRLSKRASAAKLRSSISSPAVSYRLLSLLIATPALLPVAAHAAEAVVCRSEVEQGPILIDATCTDPKFNKTIIDSTTTLTEPYAIHKVSGHFEGTTAKFNIYLPPEENRKGRFYRLVYPLTDGNANEEALRLGLNG